MTLSVETLRVLEAAATPGRWLAAEVEPNRWGVVVDGPTQWLIAVIENGAPGDSLETEEANAKLVVALRNAAPGLLQLLEDAREGLLEIARNARAMQTPGGLEEDIAGICRALLARFEEVRS